MKTAYIKHPIDKDTKERINALGYCVIDAKFQPTDYILPDELKSLFRQPETVNQAKSVEKADTPKRKGRPPKNPK